jgi:hypothetical protein
MADDRGLEADVRWSAKGRALLALTVPFCAWLAWYAFTSATQPSPTVGYLAIAGTVGAIVLQVHCAVYRVVATADGIVETSLRGTRRVPWKDVTKVEFVAQARDGDAIRRWASSPEEAFHVVVHTRRGRVSVHRWMANVDALVASLQRDHESPYRVAAVPPADRDDPSVKSVLAPSPLHTVVQRAGDGLALVQAAVVALPLSCLGGLMVAILVPVRITGSPWIDGVLLALVPWALALAGYKWIERVRRARFGAERAKPPIGAKDVLLTVAAAISGPFVLAGFLPRALAPNREVVDFVLLAIGALLCWVPINEVRKALRE